MKQIYLSEDFIARDYVADMFLLNPDASKEREYLKTIPREDMIKFHHTEGRYIRNKYNLWDPDRPLTKDAHPDDVSMNILYKIWDILNGPITQ